MRRLRRCPRCGEKVKNIQETDSDGVLFEVTECKNTECDWEEYEIIKDERGWATLRDC